MRPADISAVCLDICISRPMKPNMRSWRQQLFCTGSNSIRDLLDHEFSIAICLSSRSVLTLSFSNDLTLFSGQSC